MTEHTEPADHTWLAPRSERWGAATPPRERGPWLTPESGAVAGFTVSTACLLGQNLLVVGVQAMFGQGFGGGDVGLYYLTWGLSVILPLLLVAFLVRPALRSSVAWAGHLARAAVLVAGVSLLGAALTAVGGLVQGNPLF